MGIRNMQIILHEAPFDVKEDFLGAFFMNYGKVRNVSPILSKSGFTMSHFVLQVTLTRETFVNISNELICHDWTIYNVVEG